MSDLLLQGENLLLVIEADVFAQVYKPFQVFRRQFAEFLLYALLNGDVFSSNDLLQLLAQQMDISFIAANLLLALLEHINDEDVFKDRYPRRWER